MALDQSLGGSKALFNTLTGSVSSTLGAKDINEYRMRIQHKENEI